MEKVRYMISDAAGMLKVESHVLRYWEEELDLEVPRNEMGHRYYTEENIRQFEQIKKLKGDGYQLKAIKMLIHNMNPDAEEAVPEVKAEKEEEEELSGSEDRLPAAAEPEDTALAEGQPLSKLDQFQLMMNDIVRRAIAENNQALGLSVGEQVGEKVIKEMNYLMREREEAEEERYRKLDEAIRSRQRRRRREKKSVSGRKDKSRRVGAVAGESTI